MTAAVYDIAVAYDEPLIMGRDGTPLAAYRTTRNGVTFGALHANPESARAAANLALYHETMGYPPLVIVNAAATEGASRV